MVRAVHVTLLLLSATTHVRTQFFDFFPALQPIGPHTLRPLFPFDYTTRRPKTKTTRRPETTRRTPFSFYSEDSERRTTKRVETTTRRASLSFYSEDLERDKQKTKNAPVYDFYSTTTKPSRKTTKANPIRRHYNTNSENSNSNVNKLVSKETSSGRNSQISRNIENGRNSQSSRNSGSSSSRNSNSKPNTVNISRDVNVANIYNNNNDRLIFDDGKRNTVINYETTRPSYTTKNPYSYDTNKKNTYTTSNPLRTVRPGVKPLIVNGPPITNRPPTRRPSFGPRPEINEDVSPELIIGPNEDYMTTVEKKRYIELAEKMCDKYKALDIEQIQAIPLVPSPDPVRVNVSTCTPNESPLVVGGRVASIQEFRHMALLGWSKLQVGGYAWKCGGSLISNQFVLTAAHCAYQDRDNSVAVGPPQVVQLGSSYLDDPGAVVMKVAAVIRHPKYKLPKSYYDIAVVKMKGTVSFSSVIKPACLGIPPAPGKPIIATGWGRTEFGGDQSEELRSVSLPIWDMTECYEVLGTSRRLPQGPSSDSQICAGEKKGGKDTCQGDSGGPAQIQDGCSWRVVAVTSVGRSCGAVQTPALYAKVPRAFVSAVVFAGQLTSNQPNNNQATNNQGTNSQGTNSQQWNNNQGTNSQGTNSQQWNNNQGTNSQQWNNNQGTNSQGTNNQQWNNNQGTTTQQTRNPSQWNTNKPTNQWNNQQQNNQPTNTQWNNQQSNNNNQPNFNNNQQDNSWYWNRNQGDPNNNQNYQGSNNNVKRNDPNFQNHNNNRNNGFTTEKPVYNSQSGYYTEKPIYNNRHTTEKPAYNSQSGYYTEKPIYNNRHTTEKPVYNSQSGYYTEKPIYNNRHTTEKPVYNSQSGYYTERPVFNQNGGYNGYAADKPVYNNGFNNGYTSEKPGYSQNGYYNDGAGGGFRPDRGYYNNDDNIWWT